MALNLLEILGEPLRKIILVPRTRNKSAFNVSPVYVRYGRAIETVLRMQELPWYETRNGYLVCGIPKEGGLPTLKVEVCFEDGGNLSWLVKRNGKENWEFFYTPVEIKSTPRGKLCFLYEEQR